METQAKLNITRVALAVALAALLISLTGNVVALSVAINNRHNIRDAERGLTCLLQRAVINARMSTSIPSEEARQRAIEYYNREIKFLGGPRTDCLIELPQPNIRR